jgi:uncharacterized LabA/DUF88 family protein
MQRRLAVFIDFENIARGARQHHLEERVDLRAVLDELESKGRIQIKRAYADWGYFKDYRSDLLQHGIEPVQVFAAARDREGWKNGADIRIAIDAMETAFRFLDITDYVLVSGDSDFLSLVTRLRENGKTVWGVGLKSSSSQYLVKSCDHYIFYESIAEWLTEGQQGEGDAAAAPRKDAKTVLLNTIRRMADRQGLPGMPPPGTPLKAAAVKAAMRRTDPSWDERFEGYSSFVEFVMSHQDEVLCGRPGDATDFFVAELGTVAETNLRRMLEFSQSPISDTAEQVVARDQIIHSILRCLRYLGSPDGDLELPQRIGVRGTQLKSQLRQEFADFDEASYGFTSFLDMLLSMREHFRVVRPDSRGDVLVAERESPAAISLSGLPDATPGNSVSNWGQTPVQRYLGALRIRRIRHVPMQERYTIIRQMCEIFRHAMDHGEEISLKDAKDRLHEWFAEHDPNVPWDSVNNVVYHLFWTYCFEFGEATDDIPLWDRPTRFSGCMYEPDEVIRRCDTGLVRMISEVAGQVEPRVVLEVLGDQDESRLGYFEEVCQAVNLRLTGAPATVAAR